MGESVDQIYRIICKKNTKYCLASIGGHLVFALINQLDRRQHWIKDERYGAEIKDSEGQPAFALVNRATNQAISHCSNDVPVPLVPYNVNSRDKSVLWTMSSKPLVEGFSMIRRADLISVFWINQTYTFYESDNLLLTIYLYDDHQGRCWKFEKVSTSACISLFRPSEHTVKILCKEKEGYNLAIDKDGSTVLLVPSNSEDKYQHWIKETADGVRVKDEKGNEAFSLVNKATGKAIKLGFGKNYLVQVAPFNRNYMDPSLLWTELPDVRDTFHKITLQSNDDLAFTIFDKSEKHTPLLGLGKTIGQGNLWKIEELKILSENHL